MPRNLTCTLLLVLSAATPLGSAWASSAAVTTPPGFAKGFLSNPIQEGETTTLTFEIDNLTTGGYAINADFTDNLPPGMVVAATPNIFNNVGGLLSASPGSGVISLTNGTVILGSLGIIKVDVTCAAPGTYVNTTGDLTTIFGNSGTATDTLTVNPLPPVMTKSFTDGPATPGGTVTLEFTVTNPSSLPATDITFTDDLDACLSGLAAVGLPANDVCGSGSQISGTSLLTLSGGNLAAGASATFSVTLQVPAGAAAGTYPNTTSSVFGTVNSTAVAGDPATDDLTVETLIFSKSFDGPARAGGTAILTFTITNLDPANGVTGLGFTDDLDASLSGLTAIDTPKTDLCGSGSQLSGTSLLAFTGGNLPASGSAFFNVTVMVPADAAAGTYTNTTSVLTNGTVTALPATADLTIEPPPTFAKTFTPDSIGVGGVSTLTFTIDNTASALMASSLAFTDNLPAGVEVATPAVVSNTAGGTLTAVAGSGTITLAGGTVNAGASVTIDVAVTATTSGAFVNTTGDLTSTSGNSGTASDTLTANPLPGFAKSFAPPLVGAGDTSTLTFTIDNSASTVDATNIDFTDAFPAGLFIASTPNASTNCTGGTLTADAGAAVVSYTGGTVPAGTACTVQVDVTAPAGGIYINVTGDLTSSLGNSGTATDTLTVIGAAAGDLDGDGIPDDEDLDADGDGVLDVKDPDRDGDGVADDIDPAPDDPTTAGPDGMPGVPGLAVSKLSIRLNFAKPGKDRIKAVGLYPVPPGFVAAGATVDANVGGQTQTFTLDGNGKGTTGQDTFVLRVKKRPGATKSFPTSWRLKLKKGTFSVTDTLGAVLDGSSPGKEDRVIRTTLTIEGGTPALRYFVGTTVYKSTAKTGKARSNKP